MSTVIKVENLSKQYRLGEVGTGTLSHDLKRWWHKVQGKEDPFLKIGETNDRTSKGSSDYVWALKDVNFEVKQGEVLGIIGRNGAGKSTLLKILSKTTKPTTGSIKVNGRIASLLEVGTGFHPELTGRENIFLNGAILGMTKREIKSKFDEIVDFAGVERYIDTPVKRYSSGMYVRLAFAVAAHLEPEILIVDEVLAVGDAEFQKKCLGKMKDVSVNEGRTVLFVSHNMDAILSLTHDSLYLKNGMFHSMGDSKKIIDFYFKDHEQNEDIAKYKNRTGNGMAKVVALQVISNNSIVSVVNQGQSFMICLYIELYEFLELDVSIVVENNLEQALFCNHLSDSNKIIRGKGNYKVELELTNSFLKTNDYKISIGLFKPDRSEFYDLLMHFPFLRVEGVLEDNQFPFDARLGDMFFRNNWEIRNNK